MAKGEMEQRERGGDAEAREREGKEGEGKERRPYIQPSVLNITLTAQKSSQYVQNIPLSLTIFL
jgi:hypothetical protein